jgi:hypothetical protein
MTTVGRWSPNKVRARVLDGTWVSPETLGGMVLVTPTSIAYTGTSASIGANGSVAFTACTSLSLNGVFSADYDNYMFAMRYGGDVGTVNVHLRLRSGGTDNTTASSYTAQDLAADGNVVNALSFTGNYSWFAGAYTTQRDGAVANIYGPFLAQPTAGRNVKVFGYGNAYLDDVAFTHNQSTSYDGFTLFCSSANTISGLISVYGLVGA